MVNLDRLKNIHNDKNLNVHYGDMIDLSSIMCILTKAYKDSDKDEGNYLEIYNLAAQSHVRVSFDMPIYTAQVDAVGTLNLLEAVNQLGIKDCVKIYQASTSELFGSTPPPQSENTPMNPRSPYAIAKLFAYWTVKNYRESHNMFIVNGILFNHESERRPENFVSRKITKFVGAYQRDSAISPLQIGNMYAKRDWGYAKDYVETMWLMLQQEKAEDFVIGTGEQHTVKEFIEKAFSHIDIQIRWEGTGDDEKGFDTNTGKVIVEVNPKYYRPTEVCSLQGDFTKAALVLGWKPKTMFDDLVKIMVEYDKII
jgi:GDPmannose 4,6-dehydratase